MASLILTCFLNQFTFQRKTNVLLSSNFWGVQFITTGECEVSRHRQMLQKKSIKNRFSHKNDEVSRHRQMLQKKSIKNRFSHKNDEVSRHRQMLQKKSIKNRFSHKNDEVSRHRQMLQKKSIKNRFSHKNDEEKLNYKLKLRQADNED